MLLCTRVQKSKKKAQSYLSKSEHLLGCITVLLAHVEAAAVQTHDQSTIYGTDVFLPHTVEEMNVICKG